MRTQLAKPTKIATSPWQALRTRTEKRLRSKAGKVPKRPKALSAAEAQRLVHKLEARQVELEAQNEELRRAHADADALRARYFELYVLAPVGYLALDEKGLIQEANLAVARLLGVKRSLLAKQPFSRFVLPEDRGIYHRLRNGASRTGAPRACELRILRAAAAPSAPFFWARMETTEGKYPYGSFVCRAAISDITAFKRAEDALRASEEFARRVIDSSVDCIKTLDLDGRLLSMSEAGQRLLEIDDLKSCLNMRWVDFWKNADRTAALEAVSKAKKGGVGTFLGYCETAKGTPKWWEVVVSPIKDARGDVERLLAVSRDITERKKAEDRDREAEVLRQSEARLRALFESAPFGIALLRGEKFLYANPAYRRITGLSKEEIATATLLDHVAPECREQVRDSHRRRMAGKAKDEEYEAIGLRKDGARFPYHSTTAALQLPDGPAVLNFIENLTEKVASLEKVRLLRNQVSHMSRVAAMGELTTTIAHELSQPLAAIANNAQAARKFLERPQPDLVELREILDDIIKDDRRAGDVIHRVRALTKKAAFPRERLDVGELIRDIVVVLHGEIVMRNVSVELELSKDLPPVSGDRVQLQQVLINLLLNAFDAVKNVPGTGRIVLSTERSEAPGVAVSVRDFGPGIPEGGADALFEPFYTTKEEGLGMGLAICRTILEAHGGTIGAKNAPDGGAVFTFTLPCGRKDPA